ncbi:amidase family protein [Streptomyces roseus]|uniref:amidase family protein n=1 Tax=Streptomyces roseus TaxID=66430 RepID=UPI0036BA348E
MRALAKTRSALAEDAVCARRLTEEALERIADARPVLNAFRIVRTKAALAEAAAAERRPAAGERLPLPGVPVAVPDDTDVAGGGNPLRRLPWPRGCFRRRWDPMVAEGAVPVRIPAARTHLAPARPAAYGTGPPGGRIPGCWNRARTRRYAAAGSPAPCRGRLRRAETLLRGRAGEVSARFCVALTPTTAAPPLRVQGFVPPQTSVGRAVVPRLSVQPRWRSPRGTAVSARGGVRASPRGGGPRRPPPGPGAPACRG